MLKKSSKLTQKVREMKLLTTLSSVFDDFFAKLGPFIRKILEIFFKSIFLQKSTGVFG